jgi:YD repeat-containing protein
MKISYLRFVVTIFITLFSFQSYSQITPPKVIPLAPEAAEFAKYGNTPVSESTGIPSISIPIYEINTGKIKVPISLSYHASGIQVNQKATFVGLGWSLNAGGVISRGVRGLPDEVTSGWFNNTNTLSTIENTQDVSLLRQYVENASDANPDFFSYNMPGLSGRFFYSQATSKFQTIPNEPIRIDRVSVNGGQSVDNTYQITGVDGAHYYFQDKQSYFNDGEGPLQTNSYTQSWYLSKIISADTKDTVQFNYITATTLGGSSEESSTTETHNYMTGADNNFYEDQGSSTSTSYFYHGYMVLSEIIFKQGKVSFYSATPRKDYLGCMLDSMVVFNKGINNSYLRVQKYQLNHDYFTTSQPVSDQFDYRLRLLSLSKVPVNLNEQPEIHQFMYNELPLPSINSTSVDYWGFYNGVSFNSLLPNITPDAPELYLLKSNDHRVGGGNRNASDATIRGGILQKIIYPTGGSTEFNYECNQFISDSEQITSVNISDVTLRGIGKRKPTTTTTNIIWPNDVVNNVGTMTLVFSPHNNMGAFEYPQYAVLRDATTGVNLGSWEHVGNIAVAYTVSGSFSFDPTHTYQIILTVDDDAPTNINFSLNAQRRVVTTVTRPGAGLRIGSIVTFDNTGTPIGTDRYQYSSAVVGKNDVALANNYIKITYKKYPANLAIPCNWPPEIFTSITYYGTSGFGGQNFEGANVLYQDVRKISFDNNNVSNGQTISTFSAADAFAPINNPTLPGNSEFIDNSLGMTSIPTSIGIYGLNADGSFRLLKTTNYVYGNPGENYLENVIQVFPRYHYIPETLKCIEYPTDFNKIGYYIKSASRKLSTITETDYTNPTTPLISSTRYDYDNPDHLQITRTTKSGSDGKVNVINDKYASEFSDNSYGSDLLRSRSIKNTVVEQTVTKDGAFIGKTATAYKNVAGSIVPDYAMKALTNGAMETRLKYNRYDNNGNLLEWSNFAGINNEQKSSYKWGYNNLYPVAECKNAGYDEFFYEGFELSNLAGVTGGIAHTGNMYISGSYTVSWAAPNTRTYMISYWYRMGGVWKFANAQPYTTNSFQLTGGDAYDDIQIHPSDAIMKTFTHNPLVGITSVTDEKGKATYYEYDGLQRLKLIKDQNGNILKSTNYHFKN